MPLVLWEAGEKEKESTQGTFSLFPSSPARFLFFRLLLFFLGIPSGNLCGGERLATMSLEFEHHLQFPFGSPSTGLSDIHQSAQECKQISKKHVTRVMTSLLSSPPISILHQLFQCRYSKSRDVVASSPFFSCPVNRAPRRACSQDTLFWAPHLLTSPVKQSSSKKIYNLHFCTRIFSRIVAQPVP